MAPGSEKSSIVTTAGLPLRKTWPILSQLDTVNHRSRLEPERDTIECGRLSAVVLMSYWEIAPPVVILPMRLP